MPRIGVDDEADVADLKVVKISMPQHQYVKHQRNDLVPHVQHLVVVVHIR
jgi:hypothetical protein